MMEDLTNQVAVVTGATSGIGKAIALALAEQGSEVCLVARRRNVLEEVGGQASALGARSRVFCADLTVDESIRELAERIRCEIGRVNILVVCGGIMIHGATENAPLADLDCHYRTNLRGHYALIQALLPMLRERHGQIVFINSSVGLRAPAMVGQYSAMQHALRAIADALRDEVNADGVRVLSMYLGRTATPRMAALFKKEKRPYRPELLMQPEDVAEMVIHALRLPRTAEVTDISIRPMLKSY